MSTRRWMAGAVLVVGLVGAGCSSSDDDASTAMDTTEQAASEGDGGGAEAEGGGPADGGDVGSTGVVLAVGSTAQLLEGGRSVIRTAEVTIEADDVRVAARAAVGVAERAGGRGGAGPARGGGRVARRSAAGT